MTDVEDLKQNVRARMSKHTYSVKDTDQFCYTAAWEIAWSSSSSCQKLPWKIQISGVSCLEMIYTSWMFHICAYLC